MGMPGGGMSATPEFSSMILEVWSWIYWNSISSDFSSRSAAPAEWDGPAGAEGGLLVGAVGGCWWVPAGGSTTSWSRRTGGGFCAGGGGLVALDFAVAACGRGSCTTLRFVVVAAVVAAPPPGPWRSAVIGQTCFVVYYPTRSCIAVYTIQPVAVLGNVRYRACAAAAK